MAWLRHRTRRADTTPRPYAHTNDTTRDTTHDTASSPQVNPPRHRDTTPRQRPQVGRLLPTLAGLLAGVVVMAPVSLSAQDLYHWGASKTGLGLEGAWPLMVPVSLDAAAGLCIVLTMIAARRGEAGGLAHLGIWAFAFASAYANLQRGTALALEGAADAKWFFPLMAVAGAALLEIVLRRIRFWARTDAGVFEAPLPRFRAMRWVVARRETWAAWKVAVTEGYATPRDAIDHVRRHDRTPKFPVASGNDTGRDGLRDVAQTSPDTGHDTATPGTTPQRPADTGHDTGNTVSLSAPGKNETELVLGDATTRLALDNADSVADRVRLAVTVVGRDNPSGVLDFLARQGHVVKIDTIRATLRRDASRTNGHSHAR